MPSSPGPDAFPPELRPTGTRIGVYLHLPFCAKRCGYCSFNTAPYAPVAMKRLLDALRAEIDLVAAAPWARSIGIASIFVGGGTPSLATEEQMASLLEPLSRRFRIERGAEITVECNPESVTQDRLAGYRCAGVNRISLGVQSLDDAVLASLNRLHSASAARAAFDAARRAGFDNISADLIYGLPDLDVETWADTVRRVLEWSPEHLSAYALTLDEGSVWHAAGIGGLPPEEVVTSQYTALTGLAAEAGYEHYEISNYARPGRRSTHNQIYWHAREYVGLGPGASGFLGDVRYTNAKPVERYAALVAAHQLPIESHETLTRRQRLAERLILGLRLADGVPADWLAERLDLESRRLTAVLDAWRERELIVENAGRVRLSEAGFLLSDALFVELL